MSDKFNSTALERLGGRDVVGLLLTLAGVAACLWGAWEAWREGSAQFFASYGAATNQLETVDRAARLGPTIPEVHYARASLLADRGETAGAVRAYERAVALRPRDYALWLELGRARDRAGDPPGALAAFKEAARLAPFYALPRWQLGNALYRAGRLEESFAELRRAATSDPKFLPQVLNLAWASTGGDAQAIERAIQPGTAPAHLALARLFVRRGKISEALQHFRAGGDRLTDEERGALVKELLAAKQFAAAYEVWSAGRKSQPGQDTQGGPVILNRGFEEPISLNEPGFGWQLPQGLKEFAAAADVAEPRVGLRSLRLAWEGNADTAQPFVSQLVLVEPRASYRLSFAARTHEVVSAGLPLVMVTDAGDDTGRPLGRPSVLPQGTSPWQDYAVEFTTNEATSAVLISVRRQSCPVSPCPIFGRVWLDDFSIRKASP